MYLGRAPGELKKSRRNAKAFAILDVMNCGLHFPLVHRRRSPASFTQNGCFRQHPRRTADMPANLNSSQLRRHVGGKGLRWLLLPTAYVLICRNGIPGSTGDCVAGGSAAYVNQA